MEATRELIDLSTPAGTTRAAEYKREQAELAEQIAEKGQKLYARIKKSSKYYGQGTKGDLFEVFFVADPCGYNVIGGPGGRYRLSDVNVFVEAIGGDIRIA